MLRRSARIALFMVPLLILASVFARPVLAAKLTVLVAGVRIEGAQVDMVNGQVMVAVRPFTEAMGGYVTWLAAAQRATIHLDGNQVAVWVGSPTVFVNGLRMNAPIAVYLKDGNTMVPAWWVAARLGAQVHFTGDTLVVEPGAARSNPAPTPPPSGGGPLMDPSYVFPFPRGATYEPYFDSWGDPRQYKGRQFSHEGIDILARKGTPVVSVASGEVIRYGWNTLGGYRLMIRVEGQPEYSFYYAHLDRYAPGIALGTRVRPGQLLGYVGNTGEGPERTEGRFVPHLHFGIYRSAVAIEAYEFLRYWEQRKAQL